MKFKTRIRVTFITIIVLPLALTSLAFCLIGLYLMNTQKGLSYEQINYSAMSENIKEIVENSDKVYGCLLYTSKRRRKHSMRGRGRGHKFVMREVRAQERRFVWQQ